MAIQAINPATNEVIYSFENLSDEGLQLKLKRSAEAFESWQYSEFDERKKLMRNLADKLEERKEELAKIITLEMGKPILQSIAEVLKCARACRYYADHAQKFLDEISISTDHKKSLVHYEPLGTIFIIMPWNFPFWQVFRCAVPAIMAGNTILLKHAENVPQCGEVIEKLFLESGFPDGVFFNLQIDHEQAAKVIEFDGVQGVSLTGSDRAGKSVAQNAGKNLKRTVLELGGSDPFIVLADADIEKAAEIGVKARMQNTGQSCIAAKRFIVEEKIATRFIDEFVKRVNNLKTGDPTKEETEIGPMARMDLMENLDIQVQKSVEKGAKVLTGGKRADISGAYYQPTVLTDIPKDSPAYNEELFGPVASVFVVKDEEEAIKIANDTVFGLGAAIWTKDTDKALKLSRKIKSGSVFINSMVASDPHLPFGGIKKSGYGRELAEVGIHEFVNIKTVVID